MATPLQRGAGVIMSLVRADGLVTLPRFSEGVHAGAGCRGRAVPNARGDRAHDRGDRQPRSDARPALQRARPCAPADSASRRPTSAAWAACLALQRGDAHLAGSHLLDEETGEYNFSYVRQYCPNRT